MRTRRPSSVSPSSTRSDDPRRSSPNCRARCWSSAVLPSPALPQRTTRRTRRAPRSSSSAASRGVSTYVCSAKALSSPRVSRFPQREPGYDCSSPLSHSTCSSRRTGCGSADSTGVGCPADGPGTGAGVAGGSGTGTDSVAGGAETSADPAVDDSVAATGAGETAGMGVTTGGETGGSAFRALSASAADRNRRSASGCVARSRNAATVGYSARCSASTASQFRPRSFAGAPS